MCSQDVSVLMPVHHTETAPHLQRALESIHGQSHQPEEIVLVKDATTDTSELDDVINSWAEDITVERVYSDHTLGYALQRGLEICNSPVVARMDSDDVSKSDRLEKQLEFLESSPDVDVVGSHLAEFVDDENDITGVREVPTTPDEIRRKARFRCPMNHPTVMFRKQAVVAAGGYRDVNTVEDYDLWVRMLLNGARLANIPEVLVKARAGPSLYRRRGGLSYARTEYQLQKSFLKRGFLTLPRFLFNLGTRVPIRLVPNRVREQLYKTFFRN